MRRDGGRHLALCALSALALPAIAGVTSSAADPVELASGAIAALEREGFVGSVLVARDGAVVYTHDSGFEHEFRAIPSYWIASITKQFTAAGILLLQQRGQLDIYDPISDYLPEVPADKSEITLFQLLTHTSGLPQVYAADGIEDNALALSSLLETALVYQPGEQFVYANDNYNILAIVIESVSGQRYEDFLRTRILEPAGMKHAGFWGEPVERGTFVPPVVTPLEGASARPNWGFRGATGMRASVSDLYAWIRSLEQATILSKGSSDDLMGNHVQLSSGTEVGFNWFASVTSNGARAQFSRGNESFGGNAVIYTYPERRLTIITATNAGPAETGDGPVEGWSRKTHKVLADIFLE